MGRGGGYVRGVRGPPEALRCPLPSAAMGINAPPPTPVPVPVAVGAPAAPSPPARSPIPPAEPPRGAAHWGRSVLGGSLGDGGGSHRLHHPTGGPPGPGTCSETPHPSPILPTGPTDGWETSLPTTRAPEAEDARPNRWRSPTMAAVPPKATSATFAGTLPGRRALSRFIPRQRKGNAGDFILSLPFRPNPNSSRGR